MLDITHSPPGRGRHKPLIRSICTAGGQHAGGCDLSCETPSFRADPNRIDPVQGRFSPDFYSSRPAENAQTSSSHPSRDC